MHVGSLPDVLVGRNTNKEPAGGMWGILNKTIREWEDTIPQAQIAWHALQENNQRGNQGQGIPEGSKGDSSSISGLHLSDEPTHFKFKDSQEFRKLLFNPPSNRKVGVEGGEEDEVIEMEETEGGELGAVKEAIKDLDRKMCLVLVSVRTDQVGMMDHLWSSIQKLRVAIEADHARRQILEEVTGDTSYLFEDLGMGDLSEGVVRAPTLSSPTAAAAPELQEITDKITALAALIEEVDEDHQKAGRVLFLKLHSRVTAAPIAAATGLEGLGQLNLSMVIINNAMDQMGTLGQLLKSIEGVMSENAHLRTQVKALLPDVSLQGGAVLDGLGFTSKVQVREFVLRECPTGKVTFTLSLYQI